MEKETIEQAAKYYAHNYFVMQETNNYKALKQGFEAGAKWQQEQDKKMYSDKEAKGKVLCTVDNLIELAKIIQNTYDLEKLIEIKNYIIKN